MTKAETTREVLLLAAEAIMTCDCACRAIGHVSRSVDGCFWPAMRHFRDLFQPDHSPVYWFGGGIPPCLLTGTEEREAREHRIYALLLPAEAVE